MRQTTLGRTGMSVSRYCLGTMMLGAWGNADHDDAARLVGTALDAGINFVDTADMYSAGESEEIVGKAIKSRRDEVILATKVHFPVAPFPHPPGLDPNASRRTPSSYAASSAACSPRHSAAAWGSSPGAR